MKPRSKYWTEADENADPDDPEAWASWVEGQKIDDPTYEDPYDPEDVDPENIFESDITDEEQLEKLAKEKRLVFKRKGIYTAKTQPRDASGRFRDVLARLKVDLGDVGSAGALNKIRDAENFDYVGDYGKAAEAATDLIGIIDRLDTGALNAEAITNVREGARQLGKTIASLPFNFGDQAEKLRYSDLPPALRDLIEDMIKKVEAKIGSEDANIATKDLKSFMSGNDVYSQSDVSSQMSKLLRLLT